MDNKNLFWIDEDTGELTPFVGSYVTQEQKEAFVKKLTIEERYKSGPSFVWAIFKYCNELFPGISEASLTRLMYAATFCDNDGKLMPQSELINKMGLKKTAWYDFWNEMIDKRIFREEDGIVYINTTMFGRGKIDIDVDNNYTRLYCKRIRDFYETCPSVTQHKKMAYVFKMIPFVSRKYNILCHNPWEQDKSKVQAMSLGEFCDIIGYDRSNARRLLKDILSFKINGQSAVCFVGQDLSEETWCIVANPSLYYGGNYGQELEDQRKLFE